MERTGSHAPVSWINGMARMSRRHLLVEEIRLRYERKSGAQRQCRALVLLRITSCSHGTGGGGMHVPTNAGNGVVEWGEWKKL